MSSVAHSANTSTAIDTHLQGFSRPELCTQGVKFFEMKNLHPGGIKSKNLKFHPGGFKRQNKKNLNYTQGVFSVFFVVACDVAALMATCARCGLTLINVMQMGAHKRRCKRTTPTPGTNASHGVENFGDATNVADACAMTAMSAAVQDPDAPAVIHAPVTPLQSLARREKKGWGRQCALTFDSRPERCSGALARDFREVRAKVQTVSNKDRLSTHLSAHVQTVYLHVIRFVYENVVDTPFYT